MRRVECALVVLMVAALAFPGCKREKIVEKQQPATLEESGVPGILRVRLTQRAAERIGLETTIVREETVDLPSGAATRKIVPYGALMYDKKGATWMFTSPELLVYVRHPITVERVQGDWIILAEGPPPGTTVVTVGAAELMGAEHKYGH